ncbi:hypothetical protein [Rickettsia bellii]|uniref:Uncharacterized protein n=1 Tax=Rickettsia bellii str. RML Mogi TaxID=1359194 RepID=A0A0F3QF43_RICBE|nr:hypothetical protein [Rickettsia bellii]KJV91153.1 hypothetical protein RBEMOGI_1640 [Rickettsia bellii str. RML Mogi]
MQEISRMFIEDRIEGTRETLYSIDKGEVYRAHDIYNLTTHVSRYSILNYGLSILSMPLLVVSEIVKFFSGGMVVINQVINIPNILKDKMDQAITKKILYGFKKITSEELSDITSTILHEWREDERLIPNEEKSLVSRLKSYCYEHIPYVEAIKNFWVRGGINYSQDQLNEQKLIKQITTEIFKLGYIYGKNACVLSSDDIYNHFKDIIAYKDSMPTEEVKLVKNDWFHNNADAWDEGYFSDDDNTNLIGDDNE